MDAPLDLPLAGIAERVDVVAPQTVIPNTGTLTPGDVVGSRELEQLSPGGGFQAALRLLASVIEVPGGVAIKGGRPSQAAVQLGPGSFVDPATGLSQVRLPDDAIDSVTVLPNPYAVEFGRFSSGLVLIQTRRAGDRWRTRLNNLDPTFRTTRGSAFDITGIASFSPRVETGGPLIKDKLFLQQAAQYRYRTSDVPSRPADELRRSQSFSSFTRADANLSPKHTLTAVAGFFPNYTEFANLGTFTPRDATVDLHGGVNTAAVTERTLWSDSLFSETTVEVNQYRTEANPQGGLADGAAAGEHPRQFLQPADPIDHDLSVRRDGLGFDVVKATCCICTRPASTSCTPRLTGQSASSPVLIRRSDGTLVRRLDFSRADRAADRQHRPGAVCAGPAAADQSLVCGVWRAPRPRRRDRSLQPDAARRLGGAVQRLRQRGPAEAASASSTSGRRRPRARSRSTRARPTRAMRRRACRPLPQSLLFQHVIDPNLRTSRSLTWDLAYDHRFNPRWAVHLGVIDRRGRQRAAGRADRRRGRPPTLRLDSSGRSRYREAEVGVHFTTGPGVDLNVSYVRSQARADTNAFTTYFDSVLWPIVGQNAYAPARADAPHRMLLRSRVLPTPTWLLVTVIDWRTGLPYSTVDECPRLRRSAQRLAVSRPTSAPNSASSTACEIKKFRPWIGVRVDNALNAWLPSDVQANVTSPAFGTFYNSEYRQFRIQLRFER